jgi:hypothetical protein
MNSSAARLQVAAIARRAAAIEQNVRLFKIG